MSNQFSIESSPQRTLRASRCYIVSFKCHTSNCAKNLRMIGKHRSKRKGYKSETVGANFLSIIRHAVPPPVSGKIGWNKVHDLKAICHHPLCSSSSSSIQRLLPSDPVRVYMAVLSSRGTGSCAVAPNGISITPYILEGHLAT